MVHVGSQLHNSWSGPLWQRCQVRKGTTERAGQRRDLLLTVAEMRSRAPTQLWITRRFSKHAVRNVVVK